jgi:hypothetical protein
LAGGKPSSTPIMPKRTSAHARCAAHPLVRRPLPFRETSVDVAFASEGVALS